MSKPAKQQVREQLKRLLTEEELKGARIFKGYSRPGLYYGWTLRREGKMDFHLADSVKEVKEVVDWHVRNQIKI